MWTNPPRAGASKQGKRHHTPPCCRQMGAFGASDSRPPPSPLQPEAHCWGIRLPPRSALPHCCRRRTVGVSDGRPDSSTKAGGTFGVSDFPPPPSPTAAGGALLMYQTVAPKTPLQPGEHFRTKGHGEITAPPLLPGGSRPIVLAAQVRDALPGEIRGTPQRALRRRRRRSRRRAPCRRRGA